jgi:Tol biopolymer transport system component
MKCTRQVIAWGAVASLLAFTAARPSAQAPSAAAPVPTPAPARGGQARAPQYASRIMIYDVATKASREVYRADTVWEAPNWSHDGTFLLSNSGGKLYRIPVDGGTPEPLALEASIRANNDHNFSPDGTKLAISASSPSSRQSQIYIADADGRGARLVVTDAPSYFHGWSPDGKYLSFVANRDGKQYDIYRVPAAGGPDERLTFDPAYDDGTDYSPDGRWIYFNSDRGGDWNIWRIPADGGGPNDSKAQQVTNDALEDWFPHPSPDGRTLLYLSFPDGTQTHNDRNQHVQIRTVPMPGDRVSSARPQVLAEFMGGQGTINVNSWAPDSKRFAYVVYEER